MGTVNNGADANLNRGDKPLCDGCGTHHFNPRTEASCHGCYFFRQKHPDFNYEKVSWKDSAIGKAYAKAGAEGLKGSKILREGKLVDRPQQQKRDKGTPEITNEPKPLDSPILPGTLSFRSSEAVGARIFLDTGNRVKTLIKKAVVLKLVSPDKIRNHEIIYRAANGTPMPSMGSIELNVVIIFDINNDVEKINNLRFDIVEELEIPDADCLISFDDIKDSALLVRIPNSKSLADLNIQESTLPELPVITTPHVFYACAITRSAMTKATHVSDIFNYEQEDMGEPLKEDILDETLQKKTPEEINSPAPIPSIEGPPSLQIELHKLIEEYIDLLQSEVNKEAAAVKPLKLNVDERRWTSGRESQQRFRVQSAAKDKEIQRQINLMQALNLIRPSTQNYRSQVHLVPKPQGKWRFCIDYRFLNDCTLMEGGAIPRIKELLHRIGKTSQILLCYGLGQWVSSDPNI